jgi:hypothetical protein
MTNFIAVHERNGPGLAVKGRMSPKMRPAPSDQIVAAACADGLSLRRMAVFSFPAETRFYSRCLCDLAFPRASTVAEMGSGDGSAVIAALREHPGVTVSGVERDPESAQAAKQAIARAGISGYEVVCGDFVYDRPPGRMLVANPPTCRPARTRHQTSLRCWRSATAVPREPRPASPC